LLRRRPTNTMATPVSKVSPAIMDLESSSGAGTTDEPFDEDRPKSF